MWTFHGTLLQHYWRRSYIQFSPSISPRPSWKPSNKSVFSCFLAWLKLFVLVCCHWRTARRSASEFLPPPLADLHRIKQVIIWWSDVRAVGLHCSPKICHGLSFCMGRVLFLWASCVGGQQWTWTSVFEYFEVSTLRFVQLVPQETYEIKMLLFRDKTKLHTSVSTAGAITNFGRKCCHMHPRVLTSHHHSIDLFAH